MANRAKHGHLARLYSVVRVFACVGWMMWGASLSGCTATGEARPSGPSAKELLEKGRAWQAVAIRGQSERIQADAWLRCATLAHDALATDDEATETAAELLATQCSRAFFDLAAQGGPISVTKGMANLDGIAIRVDFRGMPASLGQSIYVEPADQAPMQALSGVHFQHPGFGVPMVAFALPCTDQPICRHYPPEGIFRPATMWLEASSSTGAPDAAPVLVLQNPLLEPEHMVGSNRYEIAEDVSAPLAQLLERTSLKRLAWWGMIGGAEVGRRSGLFLLDDYDPNKTPIIMIHGVAGSPVIWARLSNAITGDPELHRRYQIWHVVYQSNAPLLVERYRVQRYIDSAWNDLDPEGHAPARKGVVLIGHSMGGVIARLLCAESTPEVWGAAFSAPFESLHANATDLATLKDVFQFKPYPGVDEIILMAAPHRGSPSADGLLGRFVGLLAWRHIEELAGLMRIAALNPSAIQPAFHSIIRTGRFSSITSLKPDEPVTLADEKLMPAAGVRYDTIAGVLPGIEPPGDGYVPLSSALLPGSATTLIVRSNHEVPNRPVAIKEVLKILHEHDMAHEAVSSIGH